MKKKKLNFYQSFLLQVKELFKQGHTPATGLKAPKMLIKDTGSGLLTQHLWFASNRTLQAEKMHNIYIGIQNSPTEILLLSRITSLYYEICQNLIGSKQETSISLIMKLQIITF